MYNLLRGRPPPLRPLELGRSPPGSSPARATFSGPLSYGFERETTPYGHGRPRPPDLRDVYVAGLREENVAYFIISNDWEFLLIVIEISSKNQMDSGDAIRVCLELGGLGWNRKNCQDGLKGLITLFLSVINKLSENVKQSSVWYFRDKSRS